MLERRPMAKTYSDLFSEIRGSVKLISLEALKERVESRAQKPFTLVDVREKDEVRAGYIPGAVHVPRGFLEMQAEQKLPNKSEEIIVYCAGGTRSAFAAKTLSELGYENVTSANPGFVRWKDLKYPVELPAELTQAQLDRYSRHILLPEVGERGQEKLLKGRVLLVGAGGLGAPAALYLAAAGVGTLGLVDADTVSLSNLQRQVLFSTADAGRSKVEAAAEHLTGLNPHLAIETHPVWLGEVNAREIVARYDLVLDGT